MRSRATGRGSAPGCGASSMATSSRPVAGRQPGVTATSSRASGIASARSSAVTAAPSRCGRVGARGGQGGGGGVEGGCRGIALLR